MADAEAAEWYSTSPLQEAVRTWSMETNSPILSFLPDLPLAKRWVYLCTETSMKLQEIEPLVMGILGYKAVPEALGSLTETLNLVTEETGGPLHKAMVWLHPESSLHNTTKKWNNDYHTEHD